MAATIFDIANQLNLSTSTVSKALNGYTDVAAETRAQVLQTALELGYQPSASARNLRRGRTDKIGLFMNTSLEYVVDYLSGIIPGAVRQAKQYDKNLIIYTITDDDPQQLIKVCRGGEIDGVILFSTHYDSQTIDALLTSNFPLVVMGRRIEDQRVSYVIPDYYDGSYQATQYLIGRGHERIAFMTRPQLTTANESRLQGYVDALQEAGIERDAQLIVETRLEPQSGRQPTQALLALDEWPTAIFAFHDLVALDVMQVLRENGLSVPEDIAVMGFDGLRAGLMTQPNITTIAQPLERIGQRVIEVINQQIIAPDMPPVREIVPVELVIRGSA